MKKSEDEMVENIDARDLLCPLPVLKLRKSLKKIAHGQSLKIVTTDPIAIIDIPHFCSQEGHTLIETESVEKTTSFLIRKKK